MNFQYNISAGKVKLETNTNKYLLDKIVKCEELIRGLDEEIKLLESEE